MKKAFKPFKINVVIVYYADVKVKTVRHFVLSTLKNLAWLYRLDYNICENTPAFEGLEGGLCQEADIVYFRSSKHTHLTLKEFQKLFDQVFAYKHTQYLGCEMFYQNQKGCRQHPFPKHHFYRPLNYPRMEEHKDNQVVVKLPYAVLAELFPEIQDS